METRKDHQAHTMRVQAGATQVQEKSTVAGPQIPLWGRALVAQAPLIHPHTITLEVKWQNEYRKDRLQ